MNTNNIISGINNAISGITIDPADNLFRKNNIPQSPNVKAIADDENLLALKNLLLIELYKKIISIAGNTKNGTRIL